MTQQDKQSILTDLCARLPYKPKVQRGNDIIELDVENIGYFLEIEDFHDSNKPTFKLYLRPMSSMTEKERKEFEFTGWTIDEFNSDPWAANGQIELVLLGFEYLNSHHFDYRGLIGKGLAIEVTKENNPYEETNL